MRKVVVVTGAAGRMGRAVVAYLVAAGVPVRGVDRCGPPGWLPPGVEWCQVELTDPDPVGAVLSGADAMVHLAAIHKPGRYRPEVVFANNTQATFAVLHTAAQLGLRRVVVASSGTVSGIAFAPQEIPHPYYPIDEDYPLAPRDAYSLSKQVSEQICAMLHRATEMSIVVLRFPLIGTAAQIRKYVDRLAVDPAAGRRYAWAYLDVRDAATACRAALDADGIGFEIIGVAAADTLSELPSEDLARRYSPSTEIRHRLPGVSSMWNVRKAARVLGWCPQHSWRDPGEEKISEDHRA